MARIMTQGCITVQPRCLTWPAGSWGRLTCWCPVSGEAPWRRRLRGTSPGGSSVSPWAWHVRWWSQPARPSLEEEGSPTITRRPVNLGEYRSEPLPGQGKELKSERKGLAWAWPGVGDLSWGQGQSAPWSQETEVRPTAQVRPWRRSS